MLIFEVEDPGAQKLAAISKFLSGRAADQAAKKQISQDAFVDIARSFGVNVTKETLADLISKEPLSNVLEPLEPNSGVVRFKGNTEATTGMSVDQARQVVDQNAKGAMKRRMK